MKLGHRSWRRLTMQLGAPVDPNSSASARSVGPRWTWRTGRCRIRCKRSTTWWDGRANRPLSCSGSSTSTTRTSPSRRSSSSPRITRRLLRKRTRTGTRDCTCRQHSVHLGWSQLCTSPPFPYPVALLTPHSSCLQLSRYQAAHGSRDSYVASRSNHGPASYFPHSHRSHG